MSKTRASFPKILNSWAKDPMSLLDVQVGARRFGKEMNRTNVQQVQAILPINLVLQIWDIIHAGLMQSWMDGMLAPPGSAWCGGGRGTQVTDITHSLAMCLSLGRD